MNPPTFQLIGGPLDGAAKFIGTATTSPDGTVAARAHGSRSDYWLLYRGEVSFCDCPTRLEFVGYMPVDLHPTNTRQGGA